MSYNGSGVYTLPGAALANGEIVSATENNTFRNDVASALNVAWTRDGQAPATANIPMGNHKLTGLSAGTGNGDSVRFEQIAGMVTESGTQTLTNKTMSTGSVWNGGTISITYGGTGATTAAGALTSLGAQATLVSGTNIKTVGGQSLLGSGDVQAGLSAATSAQAQAGTSDSVAITPLQLRNGLNASGSAPVYACRAWVNFNGTGTVAIRASGNVSSITDGGTGQYTINFTNAMPDANYTPVASGGNLSSDLNYNVFRMPDYSGAGGVAPTSSACKMTVVQTGVGPLDIEYVYFSVFR